MERYELHESTNDRDIIVVSRSPPQECLFDPFLQLQERPFDKYDHRCPKEVRNIVYRILLETLSNHHKNNTKSDESDFEYIVRAVSDLGSAHKKSKETLETPSETRQQERLDAESAQSVQDSKARQSRHEQRLRTHLDGVQACGN